MDITIVLCPLRVIHQMILTGLLGFDSINTVYISSYFRRIIFGNQNIIEPQTNS